MVDFKLHALYLFFIVSVCLTDIHLSIFLSYCYCGCLSVCLSNWSFMLPSIYTCMSYCHVSFCHSIILPKRLSVFLSIQLLIHISIHLFLYVWSPCVFPSFYNLVIVSVFLSVCLSIQLFLHLSIHLSDCHISVDLSIILPKCLSVCLSIQLFLYLSIHLFQYVLLSCVCPSFYQLVNVPGCLSVLLSNCSFISPSICLTVIYLSIYLTSCRNAYLSFCPFNYSLSLHLSVCPCICLLLVRPSVPPFMCLSVRLSFLPSAAVNIRLGCMSLTVTNILAFCGQYYKTFQGIIYITSSIFPYDFDWGYADSDIITSKKVL